MASRIQVRGIDEELWFGDYSDADAEKKAAESVAATVGRVVGAKPFPIAAQRLADATRDPDCSLIQVVRILERDMALSARVLRLVNSASFALRTPCTSVRHAAALVGTQKLNQLATTAAILDMVDHTSVHASRILEHSAVVGGLCRYLGVHLGLPADELFTCGFLHDIGKLMLLEVEGKKYGELLTEVGAEYDAIHLYERELFGFDHALLAGHVLSRWSIPDPVPKVVAWHHHVTRAYEQGPRWASLCSVLRLADLLSYALTCEDDEVQVERVARSESASYLDISAAQLAAIWDELRNLHERSRALFRGEEPPDALPEVSLRPAARAARPSVSKRLQPSHPSLRPPTLKGLGDLTSSSRRGFAVGATAKVEIKEQPEGPKQFPCVVCSGPSFANVCPACHGYVCPEHQSGPDDWCKLCRTEYMTESHGIRLRPILVLMFGAGIGATILGASVNMAMGRGFGSPAVLAGPLIGTCLAAGLAAIFHRYARRAWFLRTRPNRSAPGPAHISTPLPPDPNKEAEKDHVPDSGVRDSSHPAHSPAAENATPEHVQPILGRASGDVSHDHVSLRALALSNAAVTPASGNARPSRGPESRRARNSASVKASAPTELHPDWAQGVARSRAKATQSSVPPTIAVREPAFADELHEAPVRKTSLAPAEELSHGAQASEYPVDGSSREAAERGRTLKLLSEHGATSVASTRTPRTSHAAHSRAPSTPPVSAAPAASIRAANVSAAPAPSVRGANVSAAPAVSVRATPTTTEPSGPASVRSSMQAKSVSAAPIPTLSARPSNHDTRRLEFPDYSKPPPASSPTRELVASTPPVASRAPVVEEHVETHARAHEEPAVKEEEATRPSSSRAAETSGTPQTWQAVLQATGTAEGW